MIYSPKSWYWIVGADDTKFWSGAQAAFVQSDDEAFQKFKEDGNLPTPIDSEQSLFQVLADAGIDAGAIGSAAQKASVLLLNSTVSVTSADSSLSGNYRVSQSAMADIGALQTAVVSDVNPAGDQDHFPYTDADGNDHLFTKDSFKNFATAYLRYVFALRRCAGGKSDQLPAPNLTIA